MQKLLQLTNSSIGAVAVNGYLPFGIVTGRINCPYRLDGDISVSTNDSNLIVIGTSGYYKITYTASLELSSAGNLGLALIINGATVYTTTITGVDGSNNVSFAYEFKVKCDSVPANVQVQVLTTAISTGTSNTIVEKIWS